jgi:hypothetical protein
MIQSVDGLSASHRVARTASHQAGDRRVFGAAEKRQQARPLNRRERVHFRQSFGAGVPAKRAPIHATAALALSRATKRCPTPSTGCH